MKKHKLKIKGIKIDCDGGIFRYDFKISPLVADSPVFLFMRYCMECDLDKRVVNNNRKVIAQDLREKHRKCWERYHNWADDK